MPQKIQFQKTESQGLRLAESFLPHMCQQRHGGTIGHPLPVSQCGAALPLDFLDQLAHMYLDIVA